MKTAITTFIISAGLACNAWGGDESHLNYDAQLVTASSIERVGHIYLNLTTGEQIVSRVTAGQTALSQSDNSELVWDCGSGPQCEGISTGGVGFVVLDEPELGQSQYTSMGDLPLDTLVDCVRFTYTTNILDVDDDSNDIGDGVPGFGMVIDFWDADNGLDNVLTRLPLLQIQIDNMAGNEDAVENGEWVGFIFTIDLADSFAEDSRFEIGDSDGDLQGATIGNNDVDTNGDGIGDGVSIGAPGLDRDGDGNDDNDIDGDGFFDWAMYFQFIQPGTQDLDGDGVLDGDVADQGQIGMFLGAPAGYTPIEDENGDWEWEIDLSAPAVATGTRSFMGRYSSEGFGIVNFGFTDGIPNPINCSVENYNPAMTINKALFSPRSGIWCPADINRDGLLDFFDVADFLENFAAGEDFNGDGVTNFFDVADFLDVYTAGC